MITRYTMIQQPRSHWFSIFMARKMKNTTPTATGTTVVQNARFPNSSRHRIRSSPQRIGSATWVVRYCRSSQRPMLPIRRNTIARAMNRIAASVQKPSGSTYSFFLLSSMMGPSISF